MSRASIPLALLVGLCALGVACLGGSLPSQRPSERAPTGAPASVEQVVGTPLPRVQPQVAPCSTAAAYGSVLSADGFGVPGARVAIRVAGGAFVRGEVCGPAGRFSLAGLPAGSYELLGAAPGWVASALLPWVSGGPPPAIVLDPGETLRGRVARADGGPLPGPLTLRVEHAPQAYVGPEILEVDDAGAFCLRGLPPGSLRLRAACPGWAGGALEGSSVALAADEPLLLLRRLELSGRVAGGNPALAAPVVVADDLRGTRLHARTRAGHFGLPLTHGGTWRVRASQAGLSSGWVDVSAEEAGAGELTLSLSALARLRGRVVGPRGEVLAGASLSVDDGAGQRLRTTSNPDGGFALALPGESATLQVSFPGLAEAALLLTDYDLDAPLEVRLEALVPVVRGAFVGSAGEPLRVGLTFDPLPPDRHLHAVGRVPFDVALDAQGVPEFSGLPDGVWIVSFPEPASDELRAWVREVDTHDEGLNLAFTAPAQRGKVAGHVALRGLPADAVQLVVLPDDDAASGFRFRAARFPAADGSFEFSEVPAGEFRVQALGPEGAGEPRLVQVVPGGTSRVALDF